MILSSVTLKGFRNFKEAEINFNKKTLIIGANDVGKTNILWAIRLLLDRNLTDFDLEPKDSDFYAFEDTNYFSIIVKFTDVVEDCVLARLKECVSDNSELFLKYEAHREEHTGAKNYNLFAGSSIELLNSIEDRFYRKVLNVKYISSKRDFNSYINREKKYLFQVAKENRNIEQTDADNILYSEIKTDLQKVDEKIPKLNFIASATNTVNEELSKLSFHHTKQKVTFDASTSDTDKFINDVSISSKSNDKSVLIGGDGRLNQIYLALWASKNYINQESLTEVTIFCIEEPEAHLHPHQQRKLADYLNSSLNGQVILTSHSPQIASEFSPNSIIRLFNKNEETKAASGGCSEIIKAEFLDFGYRLSIIPAEAFFSDVVLLIEGVSEELFYKSLAKQMNIDLDRLNISIMMVDGVGFATFIKILNSLEIEWVLRTDNDIFKIPKTTKDKHRFAGIQRCVDFYKKFYIKDKDTDEILDKNESNLKGFISKTPSKENIDSANIITKELESYGMYLAKVDLENDLYNSELKEDLESFFSELDNSKVIQEMQKRKAKFMYDFLRTKKEILSKLKDNDISLPLKACKKIIENIQNETN